MADFSPTGRTLGDSRGLTPAQADAARARLVRLRAAWNEVLPTEDVRYHAARLLRRHPLRAADALQLAAALVWTGARPCEHAFLTFDTRLEAAARLEGFRVPGIALSAAAPRRPPPPTR